MEMNLEEALRGLKAIKPGLEQFVNRDLIYNSENKFMVRQLESLREELYDSFRKIDYLTKEIIDEGYLVKREDGKYALSTNRNEYWSCGRTIEAFIIDDDYSDWIISRVEYKNGDYYIVACPDLSLAGLKVRVRR